MPKRQRSPSPGPQGLSAPRPKLASSGQNHDDPPFDIRRGIADLFPLQEIFLRILSFLPPSDLAKAQKVNKYWAKMSVDQQLWKKLYLSRYPHPHHSRLVYTTPTTPARSLRPIARLPSRAFPPPSPTRSPSANFLGKGSSTPEKHVSRAQGIGHATLLSTRDVEDEVGYGIRNDGVDWKMMLRLGTNWSNGNALSQATIPLPPSPSPSASGLNTAPPPAATSHEPTYSEQHIALTPSFIFTSSPDSPLVQVHPSSSGSSRPLGIIPPPPGWSSPSRPDNVTAICADQSVVAPEEHSLADGKGHIPARLAVFHQSGGFVILTVKMSAGGGITWLREAVHPPQTRPRSIRRRPTTYTAMEGDSVVLATLHHPVILTCTQGFHLSVYSLEQPSSSGEPSRPKHMQTMHSDVSFHPAALTLFPHHGERADAAVEISAETRFRAALTYCTPLYPSSWTIAVQEFNLDITPNVTEQVQRGECWNVGRGDDADSDELVWPKKVKSLVGVKGSHAVGVGMDGRWCVLAGADNQIQVYTLPTPTPSPSPPPTLRTALESRQSQTQAPIVHAQTLLAHSAAVTSISLAAGRCVSGGRDGRVLVWELDNEVDDEVHINHGRVGRTVGYVEVRPGGRRKAWMGAAGPDPSLDSQTDGEKAMSSSFALPHPQAISTAARSLFLPRPPMDNTPIYGEDEPRAIKHLAFDEEKIVGLIRGGGVGDGAEFMRVWNFG